MGTDPATMPRPRVWIVDLLPGRPTPLCRVPGCPGPGHWEGHSRRAAALAHLATHARREPSPAHLRICYCRSGGCLWHPRHRGCDGPVRLVLFRHRTGRRWTLIDACTACAAAIPHSASPDELTPNHHPRARRGETDTATADIPSRPAHLGRRPGRHRRAPQASPAALTAILTYLASALDGHGDADTRLLALICTLRARTDGTASLPRGLLHALHIHRPEPHLHTLTQAHWIQPTTPPFGPSTPRTPLTVSVLDLRQQPLLGLPRRRRNALADWTRRTLATPDLRTEDSPTRLAALHLAALAASTPPRTEVQLETAQLQRMWALPPRATLSTVRHLHTTGRLHHWHQPHPDTITLLPRATPDTPPMASTASSPAR